jgi:outer membrane receptor for ferric coprogen and ferric-rhodotorulic acid
MGHATQRCQHRNTSVYAANVYQISISSTTLDQALKQLAIQTGTTISYDSSTLSKIKSASLKEIIQ